VHLIITLKPQCETSFDICFRKNSSRVLLQPLNYYYRHKLGQKILCSLVPNQKSRLHNNWVLRCWSTKWKFALLQLLWKKCKCSYSQGHDWCMDNKHTQAARRYPQVWLFHFTTSTHRLYEDILRFDCFISRCQYEDILRFDCFISRQYEDILRFDCFISRCQYEDILRFDCFISQQAHTGCTKISSGLTVSFHVVSTKISLGLTVSFHVVSKISSGLTVSFHVVSKISSGLTVSFHVVSKQQCSLVTTGIPAADPGFAKGEVDHGWVHRARAYNGRLGTDLPAGSSGRAPGEGKGQSPLNMKAFCPFSYKRWAES